MIFRDDVEGLGVVNNGGEICHHGHVDIKMAPSTATGVPREQTIYVALKLSQPIWTLKTAWTLLCWSVPHHLVTQDSGSRDRLGHRDTEPYVQSDCVIHTQW